MTPELLNEAGVKSMTALDDIKEEENCHVAD